MELLLSVVLVCFLIVWSTDLLMPPDMLFIMYIHADEKSFYESGDMITTHERRKVHLIDRDSLINYMNVRAHDMKIDHNAVHIVARYRKGGKLKAWRVEV